MKLLFSLVAIVLLAGCTVPRMNTASGRPEVLIQSPLAKVKPALAAALVNKRYLIISDSEMTLVAEGDAGGWADFWFTNTLTGERPRSRIRFTLLNQEQSTRVIAALSMAHAPGWGGRSAEEENPYAGPQLQYFLDCLAADIEGRARPSAPPKPPKPALTGRMQ